MRLSRFYPLIRPALVALALASPLLASASQAEVLLSNLAEPTRDTTAVSDVLWAAQSFFNDGDSHHLTNIRAVVGGASGDPDVLAELREGSTTGTLLSTFALPSFGGAYSARTFTPLSNVTLNPGGTYFFILGVTGGGFGWSYAKGNNQVGTASFGQYEYSDNQAATWTNFGADNPYLVEVNVGSVPEPGVWGMMILGFGLAGTAVRRRRGATVSPS